MDHAIAFSAFTSDTHREVVGPDTLYIPTTQIRVKPNGDWHRRGPEDETTACGVHYTACAIREYEAHTPGLCPACFTVHERTILPGLHDRNW